MSLFSTCGWLLRLAVTVMLLVWIHPALGLLAIFAVPTVLTSTWRPGIERMAEERGASARRLARHLFETATIAPPGKDVRVTTVGEIGFLRGFWLEGSRRLAWLEDYAASFAQHTDAPVPERLTQGIRLEHVCFSYPGSARRALEDVNLELPPGAVVAIVGENGA